MANAPSGFPFIEKLARKLRILRLGREFLSSSRFHVPPLFHIRSTKSTTTSLLSQSVYHDSVLDLTSSGGGIFSDTDPEVATIIPITPNPTPVKIDFCKEGIVTGSTVSVSFRISLFCCWLSSILCPSIELVVGAYLNTHLCISTTKLKQSSRVHPIHQHPQPCPVQLRYSHPDTHPNTQTTRQLLSSPKDPKNR